ncbi:hypothetical protein DFH07DRAFT_1063977 [Mycena maculata]|uniref:Protein PNS1 n=1 Tax=Mycena maculata TaxID=230809 RepID=A0AAD7IEQ0_9AGAR|nr:hypothetical protein DFH07DRAFT_1063977 [Mycena maculata]
MSFSTYASQFLSRPKADPSASSTSGTQPLFFSFTTDEASVQLDDAADPHFQKYDSAELQREGEDEEDPYLRLDDEDEQGDSRGEHGRNEYPEMDSEAEGEGVGWLAHQRSPSPAYTLSPPQPSRVISPNPRSHTSHNTNPMPPPPSTPPAQSLSLALSESLLPRTGAEVHAFHLPAPHSLASRGRSGRRKPQPNPRAAAAFLFTYSILCVLSFLSLVLPNATERSPPAILHTIPLVIFLTILSALLSYMHLALLRAFLRPVLLLSALAPPLALFLSSVLAFAGSFSAGAGWGLRLFALIPLVLAVLSVRRLPAELQRAARSPALLSLSTRILFFRAPLLLLLSPLILLAALILSLPLLTLLVRLPLSHSWYLQLGSAAVAAFTMHVYFVARAVQRSVVAGGVGAWYFNYSIAPPPPGSSGPASLAAGLNTGYPELDAQLRILHAALHRPLGPLVLAALFSLILSMLSLLQLILLYLPLALPYRFIALFADIALTKIHALGERIGGGRYTGVYCGLTGVGFWEGVNGVREVRSAAAERALPTLPLPRPYTLALPFALFAYLRAAGDREGEEGVSYAEQQRAAVAVAVLAGAVCAAVGVFCAGVVRDCSDTLYVCHLVDRAAGKLPGPGTEREGERGEVWGAFDPSPVDPNRAPLDLETGFGFAGLGAFNFGGFGLGGGAEAGGERERERGGRGEEPVYARLRRTSEEANRKVPPPPPVPAPMSVQRGRDMAAATASRGFRAPSGEFSALRDLSPPPRLATAQSAAPRAHVEPASDSDVDSLDSREGGGGESSGAFPGSGFF